MSELEKDCRGNARFFRVALNRLRRSPHQLTAQRWAFRMACVLQPDNRHRECKNMFEQVYPPCGSGRLREVLRASR